ncbi:hypothetical protein LR002_02285 [Candidatus Gracilibacteria bacterium]|nr:hypothetical protein [Candidatus Gracilibacteria bacterium]
MSFEKKYNDYNSEEIKESIDNSEQEIVKNIQGIKKDIIKKIFGKKMFNSQDEIGVFKDYLEKYKNNLEKSNLIEKEKNEIIGKINNILKNKDFLKDYKVQFEKFYKKQTPDSLIKDFSVLGEENLEKIKGYNGFFEENIQMFLKFSFVNKMDLKNILKSKITRKEKEITERYLNFLQIKKVPNSRAKNIYVENIEGNFSKNDDIFVEKDFEGNNHFFSFNDILNDLETFGIECGNINFENSEELKGEIQSPERQIKTALAKNNLLEKRNQQENLIFGFKERDLLENKDERNGFSAEKIVEWFFRYSAQHIEEENPNLKIKIIQASKGEDEKEKNDLFIKVKNLNTGISVQKELQMTLNSNPDVLKHKRFQIERRKKDEKNIGKDIDLELLHLQNLDFARALKIWRLSNRPIGGLKEIFSNEDKKYLEETFSRILEKIVKKIK